MSCSCGCCYGTRAHAPADTANAPGQTVLRYRAGVHGSFMDAMLARLSDPARPALAALRTRATTDPSIALLDAGATMLDVLTFYQERIANEAYLRTATERRSLLELARLVGYRARPGLSASAYLAFTVEKGHTLTLPIGTKAQSVPGQDELPRIFETSEPLDARAEWSQLVVRRTRPQLAPTADLRKGRGAAIIWLKGTAAALHRGDALLVEVPGESMPRVYRVFTIDADQIAQRTRVGVRPWSNVAFDETLQALVNVFIQDSSSNKTQDDVLRVLNALSQEVKTKPKDLLLQVQRYIQQLQDILKSLKPNATKLRPWISDIISALADATAAAITLESPVEATPSDVFDFTSAADAAMRTRNAGPRNSLHMPRALDAEFNAHGASTLGIITALRPDFRVVGPALMANARVSSVPELHVYALRVRAPLFGHNATVEFSFDTSNKPTPRFWNATDVGNCENRSVLHLDARYDAVLPGSWVVVDTSGVPVSPAPAPQAVHFPLLVTRAVSVETIGSRTAYGLTGPSTTLTIADDGQDEAKWMFLPPNLEGPFDIIRHTSVLTAGELLELAEAPIDTPVCGAAGGDALELSSLETELRPGRWVIVSGERTDVPGTSGITGSELRLISGVTHDVACDANGAVLPGETMHTFVTLATSLDYCYVRASVVVWGNVIGATNGETRRETLGGGDALQPSQRFTLRASPLTYTAAPTAEGAASTLELRVNEVLWHEVRSMAGASPVDHVYVTSTSDDDKTTITTGGRAARLPTGRDNVRAVYRTGIGSAGNVDAGRISLLGSRPLGLRDVVNPLRTSGGADADSAEQLRRNAPLGLQSLDRLVSLRDYAEFARAFAGIGKASAVRLSDGQRELVHVTVAGLDDVPILPSSDLFVNLQSAFTRLGDARQPVQLDVRELVLLVLAARIRVAENYSWELVEPHVRATLLKEFGFDARDLGQPLASSEVLGVIARVPGVAFVDLDTLGGIPGRRAITPLEIAKLVTARVSGSEPDQQCGWLPPFCPVNARLAGPDENGVLAPAQLVLLRADVPETLVLTSIP